MSPLPAIIMLLTCIVILNGMAIRRRMHQQRMDHLRRMREHGRRNPF